MRVLSRTSRHVKIPGEERGTCVERFEVGGTIRVLSRFAGERGDGSGSAYSQPVEDSSEERRGACVQVEPGAASIFAKSGQVQHCAESAAGGDHDLYCGAIFHSDDYAARNAECASGAQ